MTPTTRARASWCYDPYSIVDLRLSYDAPHYTIYAEANNLFDKSYYDLGNVEQPGLWMKAGVKVNFDILKRRRNKPTNKVSPSLSVDSLRRWQRANDSDNINKNSGFSLREKPLFLFITPYNLSGKRTYTIRT